MVGEGGNFVEKMGSIYQQRLCINQTKNKGISQKHLVRTQLCLFAINNSHLSTIALHLFLLLSNSSVQQVCALESAFGYLVQLFFLPWFLFLGFNFDELCHWNLCPVFKYFSWIWIWLWKTQLRIWAVVTDWGVCFLHCGEVGEHKVSLFNFIHYFILFSWVAG